MARALTRPDQRPGGPLVLLAVCTVAVATLVAVVVTVAGNRPHVTSSRAAADAPCPAAAASEPAPEPSPVPVEAVTLAHLDEPTWVALDPARPGQGVVTERPGRVRMVTGRAISDEVAVDLTADTADDGDGGLLAAAYDPTAPWLYLWRSTPSGDDVLTAHRLDGDRRPAAAGRVVLQVDRTPSKQHHGGALAFGPDGLLYLALGDGGGLGDPGDNAQDPGTLLGKVLRIRPTPEARAPYAVPADNPFVGSHGWRPETWALGVRNPFRLTVDGEVLWLGDVGQSCWEELDRLTAADAGANLGWDRREGPAEFEGGELPGRAVEPVLTRSHRDGWCAIVAGYVPRGGTVPALEGLLLHTDYCGGRIFGLDVDDETRVVRLTAAVESPVAIVPGPSGAPWVLTLDGDVLELL